jgi:glycosyltransferase involved in cell wall biosynthesis
VIALKVCLVYTSGISVVRGGGIACKIMNIIKETSSKIDYTILTSVEKADDADMRFLNNLGVDVEGISLSHNSIIDCWKFFKSAPNTKFDIIHFHELPLAWDVRFGLSTGLCLLKPNFRNAALVYEHQIAIAGNLHPLHLAWQYTVFKALFPMWDTVVLNSKYMLNETLSLVQAGSEKIKMVQHGVDSKEIQNATPLGLDGIPLLFFGHLSFIKGVDVLVKAFYKVSQRNRDVHLYIVGDGRMRGFCEDFVRGKNLSDRVHFWGAQPQNFLFRVIRGADICVLPSRNDASPLTVLEAMAAGKPIITTHRGGIPEFIKDGRNGIIVEPEPDQLARAIELLLDNPALRSKIGRNNSTDAEAYSWKKASQEYVSIYQSLVRQRK